METPNILQIPETDQLISAKEFPWAKWSFENFNPVQSALVPYAHQDLNGLIAAATSCGKTVMSELFASYTVRVQKKKFIFLCPLRALAYEKFTDWTSPGNHFSDLNIGIYTGDYKEKKGFEKNDIIIMTSEMLNHKVRLGSEPWIKDVGLVVVDESHTLAMEGRGPHLESALLNFTRINNTARIILLSGTLPNVDEVASWVQSLNKKQTFIIKSSYRPCQLKIHNLAYDDDSSVRDAISEECCRIINRHFTDKFIIFVHVKSLGNYIVEKLENRGIESEFHNANLESKERIDIENRFKNDKNLRVIVATSTLAQGLNLPARRVIIAGVHRGTQLVPSFDILQMAGRAGRPAFDTQGDAYILYPKNDIGHLSKVCTTPWPITSKLLELGQTHEYQSFLFHLLAEIYEERLTNINEIPNWYNRTLANFQKLKYRQSLVVESIEKLSRLGVLKYDETNGKLEIAALGKIAVLFYVNPYVVASYARNFANLFKMKEFNDVHICLALANNSENVIGSLSKEDKLIMRQFLDRLPSITTVQYPDAVLKNAFIHYRTLHGYFDPKYAAISKTIQQDFPRTVAVLNALDSWLKKWNRTDFFNTLAKRMKHGVPAKLVDLVEIKNIGKKRAEKLYTAGFKNKDAILANLEKAAKIASVNPKVLKLNCEYNLE
jgi:helicase